MRTKKNWTGNGGIGDEIMLGIWMAKKGESDGEGDISHV